MLVIYGIQGHPQDLAGGATNFFFRFGNLHVAKRHAAHGAAMHFARGVRGMPPPPPREIFFKWCNLVRFGVYFDQMTIFYIKELIFRYTIAME